MAVKKDLDSELERVRAAGEEGENREGTEKTARALRSVQQLYVEFPVYADFVQRLKRSDEVSTIQARQGGL